MPCNQFSMIAVTGFGGSLTHVLKLFFSHLSVHLVFPSVLLGKRKQQVFERYITELRNFFLLDK